MCGICGFNWEDKGLLDRMISEILYRGPDSKGKFFDKSVSLGNVRLSIIDISKEGNQPMFNQDNSMLIIYNGELYNYRAIRAELVNKGYVFNSETDTEVILYAYEEYGIDCLSRFNGVFAFCIYDMNDKRLFIARDPLGVKPLYYYLSDKRFIFGSEIKSILKYEEIRPSVNFSQLSAYFSFRYVPGPYTMFNNIAKLLPGHYIIFNLKKGDILVKKYWDLQTVQKINDKQKASLIMELEEQLQDSITAQTIGDVPSGVFLSGGLDSSSVLAFIKKEDAIKKINTFSLGFENQKGYENELKYAKLVSEYFGTDHCEVIISEDSLKILPKLIFHLDEPVSDATIIPTYFLSEAASKKVKFVLTGEGGDELFGGYVYYNIINKLRTFQNFMFFKNLISKAVKVIPSCVLTKMFNYPSVIGDDGKQRLIELIASLDDRTRTYLNLVSVFSESDKKDLIDGSLYENTAEIFVSDLRERYFNSNENFLTQIRVREMRTWLPDYILVRLDKIGMACSLESRVPLLDKNLVSLVNSFPYKYQFDKSLFKSVMKQHIPKEIIKRRKYPFTAPIDSWYRKGYKEMAEHILDDDKEIYRFVKKSYVNKLFKKEGESNLIHSRQIWSLLTFSLWYKIFIEKAGLKSLEFY